MPAIEGTHLSYRTIHSLPRSLAVALALSIAPGFIACDDDVHRPSGTDIAADAGADESSWDAHDNADGVQDVAADVLPDGPPDVSGDVPADLVIPDVPSDLTVDMTEVSDAAPDTTSDALADAVDTKVADTPEDAAPFDTAPNDDGASDTADTDTAPDVLVGKVPVLLAVGHVGRTIMTCDDGQSWVNNRSYDTEGDQHVCGSTAPVTCFQEGIVCSYWSVDDATCHSDPNATWCDCDHHPGSGTGVAFGDGQFVSSWGWGPKGSLRRTADGAAFAMTDEGSTFTGVAYGQGRFIAGSRNPKYSDDGGATWQAGTTIDLQSPSGATIWNARQFAFADVAGGRWVITGADGANVDVRISADNGLSWAPPSTLPPECGDGARGIASGDGRIVIAHSAGHVCTSNDGGGTFLLANVGAEIRTTVLYDGSEFLAWGNGTRFSSPDGLTWTTTALTSNVHIGAVAFNPVTQTLVAVRGGWTNWYDKQRFYRSTDGGITWDEATGAYVGSHPIGELTFGWADPSAACPLP